MDVGSLKVNLQQQQKETEEMVILLLKKVARHVRLYKTISFKVSVIKTQKKINEKIALA